MELLLSFSLTLLLATLLSILAGRSVLSLSVLFLFSGLALSAFGLDMRSGSDLIGVMAELALVSLLFTDAAKTDGQELLLHWRLPARALILGLPLVALGTAAAAKLTLDLHWSSAFLLGAVLSPTDPVFTSALVNSKKVPGRVRHLLQTESGVNDGLALPVVILLLHFLGSKPAGFGGLAYSLAGGLVLGVALPWLVIRLEERRWLGVSEAYLPILGFALVSAVFSLAKTAGVNEFLAAFSAGLTVSAVGEKFKKEIFSLNSNIAELLKLGALLLFGMALWGELESVQNFHALAVFVVLSLLVRPLVIFLVFSGSRLPWRERMVAGVFGPKGFASVVFGLMVLHSGVPEARKLFPIIASVVAASIILLSSLDILAQRWLVRNARIPPP